MMRAALMFVPMTVLAVVVLDVAVPAMVLLVCVLAGRFVLSIGSWTAKGEKA